MRSSGSTGENNTLPYSSGLANYIYNICGSLPASEYNRGSTEYIQRWRGVTNCTQQKPFQLFLLSTPPHPPPPPTKDFFWLSLNTSAAFFGLDVHFILSFQSELLQ